MYKAVIIEGPSGGGKDAVIAGLEQLGIAKPCVRDTTRLPRPGDNGFYRFISEEEFLAEAAKDGYILHHQFSGHWYGVPLREVEAVWQTRVPAILKGDITKISQAMGQLKALQPESKVIVAYLVPDPEDAWIQVLHERKLSDIEQRIHDSKEAMALTLGEYRHFVDHVVTNRFGDLETTVQTVAEIIRSS